MLEFIRVIPGCWIAVGKCGGWTITADIDIKNAEERLLLSLDGKGQMSVKDTPTGLDTLFKAAMACEEEHRTTSTEG